MKDSKKKLEWKKIDNISYHGYYKNEAIAFIYQFNGYWYLAVPFLKIFERNQYRNDLMDIKIDIKKLEFFIFLRRIKMRYDYEKLEAMLGKEFLFSNRAEKENSYKAILTSFKVSNKGIVYWGTDLAEPFDTISEIKEVEVSLAMNTTDAEGECDPYAADIEGDYTEMFICEDCCELRADEC